MSSISVIITAGGIGKRMNVNLPKQFILVNETPILMRTMDQFYKFDPNIQIILTLPDEWMSYWEELQVQHDFRIPHRVVSGGEQRYHSIKNALKYCHGNTVAVHDGVRPLVAYNTLKRCFSGVQKHKAVVPVVPISESIRKLEGAGTIAVNRADYFLVQTPQCFSKSVLSEAYEQPYHEGITDDASLVEESGVEIKTVEGNPENIKITTQSDLRYAELFLK